ncbi:hypothetical protein [Methylibium rhizosphaerae]|jgi:hypothetical protein|uniref:hypothetical protein n=1 Tax=Methylibium rhizosphaerae TaxID=2570323 RepID=UPI001126DE78|nr:hypothetical protein [Methylibium rhizosphaerae]
MSANFSRVESGTTTFVPPLGQPDPSADLSKLDRILNGPLDSGIQRQMAGKHLLENADQYADSPVDWEERPKGKEYDFWNKETGVADKPKDPRLKKDKGGEDAGKADGPANPRTLEEHFKAEDAEANKKKAEAFGEQPKPYDRDKYYDKNKGHLDAGRATDWLNEKAYETKVRDNEREKLGNDGGSGKASSDGGESFLKKPFTDPEFKRGGLSAETQYGNYTPKLREGAFSNVEVQRDAWHAGHEQVKRLNGGEGYTQTNRGLWTLTEEAKKGGTASFGMGTRAEFANVFDLPGSGEATVRSNALAGFESSAGGKMKFKPQETNISAGAEVRAGLFGEVGGSYRPVTWEPKIFGAPINLSPEIAGEGRVFTGGELGAGFKAGWRLTPDPATGRMSPEAGIEAKGSAFIGGKAEGEGSVGLAGVGNVGGSVAGLYGVGAEGKAKLGLAKDEKGRTKLKFELKGALALGLGLGAGIKGEINIDGLMRFGANVARVNREAIHKVSEGVKTAVNTVKNAAENAFDRTKAFAENAVEKTKEVANTVVDKTKEVAKTAVEKVKEVGEKIGDGVEKAAKKVGSFFKGLFK